MNIRQLVSDERNNLSSARVGLWVTVLLGMFCIGVDAALTLGRSSVRLPNTAYALLGTMFTVFASWAAGPRIAQYIGPQIGQIAAGLGASARDQGGNTTVERHDFIAHTWAAGSPDAGVL